MTVSIQEELHSGTLRQASALALIIKSFTLSLMFWAFTSCKSRSGALVWAQTSHVQRWNSITNSPHSAPFEAPVLGPCWRLQTGNSGGWSAWTASTSERWPVSGVRCINVHSGLHFKVLVKRFGLLVAERRKPCGALTLRMLLMGKSVKVPAGAAGGAAGEGGAAAAGEGAAAAACP